MKTTPLILIGYRGTGKSTLARRLGQRLDVPVFDSDPEIERRAGKTIAEIFARDGEPAFRDLEEAVIEDLLRHRETGSFVLATGGGAILRESTRQRLRAAGRVVWLTARPETIFRRIRDDAASATTRPNLTALPAEEEILDLLARRHACYRDTSHAIVPTDDRDIEEIVREVLDGLS